MFVKTKSVNSKNSIVLTEKCIYIYNTIKTVSINAKTDFFFFLSVSFASELPCFVINNMHTYSKFSHLLTEN